MCFFLAYQKQTKSRNVWYLNQVNHADKSMGIFRLDVVHKNIVMEFYLALAKAFLFLYICIQMNTKIFN